MSTYRLLKNLAHGGAIQPVGSVVEIQDEELVERLLAKGTIEPTDGAQATETEVAPAQPPLEERQLQVPTEQAPNVPSPTEQPQPGVDLTPEQLQNDFDQTSSQPSNVQLQ